MITFSSKFIDAGAGSGKTSTIVSEVFLLIKENITFFLKKKDYAYLENIKNIIIVTYTNKAVFEIRKRLEEFLEKEFVEKNDEYEKYTKKILSSVFIGTFHSFCYRVLSENFVFKELKIVDEFLIREKINDLVAQFFLDKEKKYIFLFSDLFVKIFLDSSKRKKFFIKNDRKNITFDLFFDHNLQSFYLLKDIVFVDNVFDKFFSDFSCLLSLNIFDYQNLQIIDNFFEKYNNFRISKKISTPLIENFLIDWRKIKNFFRKKLYFSLENYLKNTKEQMIFFQMFDQCGEFLEKNYINEKIFSYADLEYFVDKIDKNIMSVKEYIFIVDESQDLSPIQFDIIKKFNRNINFNLLFVGDAKQAIYGFRGGSFEHYLDFKKLFHHVEKRKINYRSSKNIVQFVNDFFCDLNCFQDDWKLEFFNSSFGDIVQIPIFLARKDDLFKKEASCFFQDIMNESDGNTVGVLYKSLTHVSKLENELQKNNISYFLQKNILLKEDLGYKLVLSLLNFIKNQKKIIIEKIYYLINEFFYFFGDSLKIESAIFLFVKNYYLYGFKESLRIFLFELNIFSMVSHVESFLENISSEYLDNIDSLIHYWSLISLEKKKISIGNPLASIQLLSVHSSKGLEFDIVYLASTTQKKVNIDSKNDFLGTFSHLVPKKNENYESNDFIESPYFLYDLNKKKEKEYFEDLRLLYTALTRAKKKIKWPVFIEESKEIDVSKSSFLFYENSWNFLLNKFVFFSENKNVSLGKFKNIQNNLKINNDEEQKKEESFFLKKEEILYFDHYCLILPEVSVTRLLSLLDCAHQFYLRYILKIPSQLNSIDSKKLLKIQNEDENDQHFSFVSSSLKEGIKEHQLISQAIKHNNYVDSYIKNNHKALFVYLEKKKEEMSDLRFFSEKELKINFRGIIINGIPDLILISTKYSYIEIIDFKTGLTGINDNNINKYWYQIIFYAYAFIDSFFEFNVTLYFTKINEFQTKKIQKKIIESTLEGFFKDKADFFNKNYQHCEWCEFKNTCRV